MTTRWNRRAPVFLWRKLVGPNRVDVYEARLRERAGNRLAIIQRPQRKRILFEVSCDSKTEVRKLEECFGGRSERLPPDWPERFGRLQKTKPIRIGDRELIIPGEAAFGTGEHPTTATSLRLLERAFSLEAARLDRTRRFKLAVDLGTGTGILVLAARVLGARRAIGIDSDPLAISTAKENARRNKIGNTRFWLADVRRWKIPRRTEIATANLFSELVIEVLPKLKRVPWLVLSGVLRNQESKVVRALKWNRIRIEEIRRRGKWIAILAKGKTDLHR